MKKSKILIGAVVSGLVAGSAANLSGAQADHHDQAKTEGKENACKGNACKGKGKGKKGNACKGHAKKDSTTTGTTPADTTTTPPAGEGTTPPAENK